MMMNGTDWIKNRGSLCLSSGFTLFSFPEIKFLRGSLGRLRDKLCFPKTKHLVDVRQPPSGEARSADHNFED